MKTLTLQCKQCHAVKTFFGNNVDEILKQIDYSQWRDMPSPKGYLEALCPTCDNELDDQYLGIEE